MPLKLLGQRAKAFNGISQKTKIAEHVIHQLPSNEERILCVLPIVKYGLLIFLTKRSGQLASSLVFGVTVEMPKMPEVLQQFDINAKMKNLK